MHDGAPVPVDPADGVVGLEILEAARRSSVAGTTVSLAG